MSKNILTGTLLMLLVFTACAQSKKTTSRTTKKTTVTKTTGTPKITSVYMMRTSCFGRCPNYVVIVNSNGRVEYQGRRFTKYTGVYEKMMGTAKTQAILDKFAAYRVDTCKTEYPNLISDVPGIYYKIMVNGKEKIISNAHFGPNFLRQLADVVDEIAQVDASWKQTADTAPGME